MQRYIFIQSDYKFFVLCILRRFATYQDIRRVRLATRCMPLSGWPRQILYEYHPLMHPGFGQDMSYDPFKIFPSRYIILNKCRMDL